MCLYHAEHRSWIMTRASDGVCRETSAGTFRYETPVPSCSGAPLAFFPANADPVTMNVWAAGADIRHTSGGSIIGALPSSDASCYGSHSLAADSDMLVHLPVVVLDICEMAFGLAKIFVWAHSILCTCAATSSMATPSCLQRRRPAPPSHQPFCR